MYRVRAENTCSCFKKAGMVESQGFEKKEEAKSEAESMIAKMQSDFCKKHEFVMNEQFGDYTIYIKPRK